MLVNCKSCQKKFIVPDSAITGSGRLLQCGSCGSKWTQYPVKVNLVEKIKNVAPTIIEKPSDKKKSRNSPKKRKINLYSEEYLKQKHGLTINNPDSNKKIIKDKNKKIKTNFGFYNYLVTMSVFIVMLFGVLHLLKDIITIKYPGLESQINNLYEAFDILKISIYNLLNKFNNLFF
jgi:predicted Zn finger-like uncharacterized protein